MDMHLIQGNTRALNFPSAVGVYIFPDNTCLLIDSGASKNFGRRIHKVILDNDLQVRALFNTHAHADHCGGNRYLREATDCEVYASPIEAAFIENPIFIPYVLYSASPIKALKNKYLMPEPSQVDFRVEAGELVINGASFRLLALPGHSLGHMGIITPDEILFAGDSLISRETLREFPFLYLTDVEKHMETLAKLRDLFRQEKHPDFVFLAHGGLQEDVPDLIEKNYQTLMEILEFIMDLLNKPREREEMFPLLANQFKLSVNRNQYFLTLGTLSACLSYLCNTKQAKVYTENDRLLFSRR